MLKQVGRVLHGSPATHIFAPGRSDEQPRFIRYPGGKQRFLRYLLPLLPTGDAIRGHYVEPFVGSASVFLALDPNEAVLSDINAELIDLYRGLRDYPTRIWRFYSLFPGTKRAYYKIRRDRWRNRELAYRAARLLYLNRTCFKGMWRQNALGEFNIGYGGQDRRWAITRSNLSAVSSRLKKAAILQGDFEYLVDWCGEGDFIFCDPPYRPGEREAIHSHYSSFTFSYDDQQRLASALARATRRGVMWAITNTSHGDVLKLYKRSKIIALPRGVGKKPGLLVERGGEVLIRNY